MPRRAARPTPSEARRNPFIIGHYAEGDAFCDRETETGRVAAAFRDPSARLLLYGDRRLGKSSTIHVAAARLRDAGEPVVEVDLASASTAPAAAQRILSAVHREAGTRWQDGATRLLARLRPGAVTLTANTDATGAPTVSFQVSPTLDAHDPLVMTEVLDAVEAELEARDLT